VKDKSRNLSIKWPWSNVTYPLAIGLKILREMTIALKERGQDLNRDLADALSLESVLTMFLNS